MAVKKEKVVKRGTSGNVRKAIKRRGTKKKAPASKKSALAGAVKDLESEIRSLNREKAELKRENSKTSSNLELSRAQERALQNKIAKIIEKQARLNQKKKNLQMKIDRDSDKIGKILKIRSEISDI